jgi:glutamate-1-semialdehyde 2,1-aminomutase
VSAILERYLERTPRSAALNARANDVMPGGDSRSTAWFAPYPPFVAEGRGYELFDVDGNRYVELLNNYTSLIHGHAHPVVAQWPPERARSLRCMSLEIGTQHRVSLC